MMKSSPDNHTVNIAIQVLPVGLSKEEAYRIVDKAIETIDGSGLAYTVGPFETVLEGTYDRIIQVLGEIQETCRAAGAPEVILNMKLQRHFQRDVRITDKTAGYPSGRIG